MNLIILALATAIILIANIAMLVMFERRIRKEFKCRLEVEQDYRHQLEKLYEKLRNDFFTHIHRDH